MLATTPCASRIKRSFQAKMATASSILGPLRLVIFVATTSCGLMSASGSVHFMRRTLRWVVFGFVLFGCGGAVETGPDGTGGNGPTNGASGSTPDSSAAGAVSTPGTTKRLGTCKLGPDVSQSAMNCPWLGDMRCYATMDEACNCICPGDVPSVSCVSDWPVDGQPTQVYCK